MWWKKKRKEERKQGQQRGGGGGGGGGTFSPNVLKHTHSTGSVCSSHGKILDQSQKAVLLGLMPVT